MVLSVRAISRIARASSLHQLPVRTRRKVLVASLRSFTTSSFRPARRDEDDEPRLSEGSSETRDLFAEMLANDKSLTDEQRAELEEIKNNMLSDEEIMKLTNQDLFEMQDQAPRDLPLLPEPKYKEGFYAMDEEPEDKMPDPDFQQDDITSLAHGELEQHREMREFARVIAWDMPLLWKHRKPFSPPEMAQALRFRYTTYLGDKHPADRKVVMEFHPTQIGELKSFTEIQTAKFVKLLGVRYNPETGMAKMSCEMHQTTAQNKRHLGDLLQKLLTEVAEGEDLFEDVPFDFRHHKFKPKHKFPEEWKMTDSRKAELDERRKQRLLDEQEKDANKETVDGKYLIERMLPHESGAAFQPTEAAYSRLRTR